jgi:protein phosphatase
MALRLVAAAKTDPGLQREQNEDACYELVSAANPASGLFVVADGMGGYHAGEIASQLAVETISAELLPLLAPRSTQPTMRLKRRKSGRKEKAADVAPEAAEITSVPEAGTDVAAAAATTPSAAADGATTDTAGDMGKDASDGAASAGAASAAHDGDLDPPSAGGAPTQQLAEALAMEHYGERLREAVEHSSEVIVQYGQDHSDARGLGSTVTAALVIDGQVFIANVGDSRTYLLRDGELRRITRDHSLVERLVEAGQIEPDEVYDHPNRNLIYRSLGAGRADVEVDLFSDTLRPGDALLLCSDGLWEMVRDPDMTRILVGAREPAAACDLLIDEANEHGGEDNITAVLVRCEDASDAG